MGPQEFAKKSTIAFTNDQHTTGARDFAHPESSRPLQCVAKGECLHPAIMRSNNIEAHRKWLMAKKTIGVSSTRSARAMRSSRESAKTSSPANAISADGRTCGDRPQPKIDRNENRATRGYCAHENNSQKRYSVESACNGMLVLNAIELPFPRRDADAIKRTEQREKNRYDEHCHRR